MHKEAMLQEMTGIVPSPDEALEMDMFIELLRNTIKMKLKVDVPAEFIMKVVGPVVPLSMDPTPSNAMHILRSSLSAKLVGPAMAAQLNRLILAEISELPVKLIPEEILNIQIRQDLIASLGQDHGGQEKGVDNQDNKPLTKMSRTSASIDENMANKTSQILWMLQNRLATSRVAETASSAADLLASMSPKSNVPADFQELQMKDSLRKHLLFLDGAVDRHLTEQLWDLREAGTFAGVAMATDESPPSQPRFRGLRFQITVLYLGTFLPVEDWGGATTPPIQKRTCLGDLMHCPGKKGADVSRCLEKQLSRLGLNSYDVVAGTGDGGGENEGHQGVHSYFESLGTGYVRRRCIPHISWRTCDLAIKVSGLDLKGICTYLCEGITWSRLRELATTSREAGGLGLFTNSSQTCKDIFGKSPATIVVSRPDTDLNFLKFLQGKEHILHRLAEKDLEKRSLNADTRAAVLTLGNIKARIHRRVLQEILERCMFLLYYNQKHPYVATSTSWEELQQKSVSEIVDLTVTHVVLERFGKHEENLHKMRERPRTWVHLAVLEVVDDENLVSEWIQEALTFHRGVSDQAAAHLNLLLDNTFRTPWLAAKLLSTDKVLARTSATSLMKLLATTRPSNFSAFEKHIFEHQGMWQNLDDFSKAEPAEYLWGNKGKYEILFRFLAPRFLLAPDHVLDCERIHARWQWACANKRAIKIMTLNGSLRLQHYLENNQVFPSDEDLLQHLHAEREQHKMAIMTLEGDTALGWRSQAIYMNRFNLAPEDRDLVCDDPVVHVPQAPAGGPFAIAWRNYMRTVLKKGFMYKFTSRPSVIFYIAENKILAGREDRTYSGEAMGRKMAIVFFEEQEGGLVRPVNQDIMRIRQELMSMAELMQTIGVIRLPHDPERTAATTELLLEAHLQDQEILRFSCDVEPEAPQVHTYSLGPEVLAETAFALETPAELRTKMLMARALQRNGDLLPEESLQSAWSLNLEALRERSRHLFPAAPEGPEAPALKRKRQKGPAAPLSG